MFRNFIQSLDQKKLKVFLVFLVFSFVSWSISKLSQTYDSWVEVSLVPTKFPDSLLYKEENVQKAKLRLKTNGFRLLGMQMGTKKEKVDLSSVSKRDQRYFLTDKSLQDQWERRFSNTEILSVQPDTLFFDLYQVQSKKVKVEPRLGIELEQNYLLLGPLVVNPDSVLIKGPATEIEAVNTIKTVDFTLKEVSESFNQELALSSPENFSESEILETTVVVSGTIVKFSEKIFELPISVENTPEGYELRVFPKKVSLLCKAGEDDLRTFAAEDFQVVASYDSTRVNQKTIRLALAKKPEKAIAIRLLQDEVKFVLEQK